MLWQFVVDLFDDQELDVPVILFLYPSPHGELYSTVFQSTKGDKRIGWRPFLYIEDPFVFSKEGCQQFGCLFRGSTILNIHSPVNSSYLLLGVIVDGSVREYAVRYDYHSVVDCPEFGADYVYFRHCSGESLRKA